MLSDVDFDRLADWLWDRPAKDARSAAAAIAAAARSEKRRAEIASVEADRQKELARRQAFHQSGAVVVDFDRLADWLWDREVAPQARREDHSTPGLGNVPTPPRR
jgi:hypothetical protein